MNDMDKGRELAYLGALLHDLGKFIQKSFERKAGSDHEILIQNFIREYFGKINILKDSIEDIINESSPNKTYSYLKLADQLNEDADNWIVDEKESIELHHAQLQLFLKDLSKLHNIKDYQSLGTSLYFLLQKYLSRVASGSYNSKLDISLFDQTRTIASLVNCLTFLIPKEAQTTFNPSNSKTDFILLKGKIAGIQKFLYSGIDLRITGNNGLSKQLKGRSFYISLLNYLFADLFIEDFQLTDSNIFYVGGGIFYLVLPYTDNSVERVNDISKKINLFLHQKTKACLSLITAQIQCGRELYCETNEVFQEVSYKLEQNIFKNHENYLEDIFFNKHKGNDFSEDKIIGENIPNKEYLIELELNDNTEISNDNLLVAEFSEFNKYYFLLTDAKNTESSTTYDNLFDFFKTRESKIKRAKLIRLNSTDFLDHADNLLKEFSFPISFAFRFTGIEVPKDKSGILEFADIATLEYNSDNILSCPQLAAIRLDIDNLESIFQFGLKEKVNFSGLATLSRTLDHFFSGYMNVLAQKYRLYIVHSGGDDAFLIGSWYNILHFAKEFYEKFQEFACSNPNLTFSAGIFMCEDNYPIAKMAEKAEELLNKSKDFQNTDGKQKNAVTVFDHTLNWDKYYAMIDFSGKLLYYTEMEGVKDREKFARSLVHRLLRSINSCLDSKGKVDTEKLYNNVAQLHFLLARHGFTAEKIKKTQDGLVKDIISLILQGFL